MTAGTGGTITGVARAHQASPARAPRSSASIPEGSILAGPGEIKSYKVEGIGYDFIPDVLDVKLVDRWIKSNDRDSFRVARQADSSRRFTGVAVRAALLSGAALQVCSTMKPGQRVVVVLPDSIRNYLSKFVSDAWMRQARFRPVGLGNGHDGRSVAQRSGTRELITLEVDAPVQQRGGAVQASTASHRFPWSMAAVSPAS